MFKGANDADQFLSKSADYGDVATWVAGIATLGAVWVALRAAERERKKAIEIQEREWKRADERLKVRTARLANAFHRDLVYAARELVLVIANLNPNNFKELQPSMLDYLINGRPRMQLPMVDRFAGDLDGFKDEDALALLTALASWRHLSGPLCIAIEDMTQKRAATIAVNMREIALFLHKEHALLNDRLIAYFLHIPGLQIVEDEVPDELRAAMKS